MDTHTFYALFHVLLVAPFLIYVGWKREEVPTPVYWVLAALAAVIFLYHSYRAYSKLADGKSAWVNWIHLGLVAPLFAVIAYNQKETPRRYFELLLMLGVAALGYHGITLFRHE
jgi:hypothetical protein